MRQLLQRHSDSPCDSVSCIEVGVVRSQSGLVSLHYTVTGNIGALRVPPVAMPLRTDGLWQSTCFEAFLRAGPDRAYYEFNFAPSTRWAAYRFDGYRTGMRAVGEIDAPRIEVQANDAGLELRVVLDLARLPDLPAGSSWRVGLSAVIEDANGRKSYWALAHPPGKPDFHHGNCFALQVPTA